MSFLSLGFRFGKPFLHALDAERAHGLTITALKSFPVRSPAPIDPVLTQRLWGLTFPNPLGLAPGFDKNADVPDAMLAMGFGCVEVGTVTPLPQAGNPKPRLFRLVEDQGVINRMGFNNDGAQAIAARLRSRAGKAGLIGVNIGANKDSSDRIGDYEQGVRLFGELASYLTVNISSPNTPGLRSLQSRTELQELLARVHEARLQLPRPVPLLLKIAPDLMEAELRDVAECCLAGHVDGVIISNTTLAREGLRSPNAHEQGGLSGAPLLRLSNRVLARFHQYTEGRLPLVGVGGVSDADSAFAKITAGASLVQVYSALVYKGPGLVSKINSGLVRLLHQHGCRHISEAIGTQVAAHAAA